MKASTLALLLLASSTTVTASGEGGPISKVFQMLASLQAKIIKEGEEAQKTYDEFSEWCEDRSRNIAFEIKTGKSNVAELGATIEKETASSSALSTKIEELSGSIATDEADLAAATKIRGEEAADFAAEEKELTEVIGMLERATAILEREMKKGSASMMQLKNTGSLTKALGALVQASVFSSADVDRLHSFIQSQSAENDDDEALGAPAAAVYEGQSGGIISTLEGILEKAQGQLASAQQAEQTSAQNYQILKQSLVDEVKFADKDMAAAKKNLAASGESKAVATGDLSVTQTDLAEDLTTLKTLHQDCMTGADDFQSSTKSRADELSALAQAKKILNEALPAAAQSYGAALDQASFLQIARSGLNSGADLAKFEAVRFIRDLARKQNSVALAQLASRMASAIRFGEAAGADPFAKVKSLIADMLATLEADAQGDASHKAYCDKETSETTSKKEEKKALVTKLTTQIDSKSARSIKLKEETATLQNELAQLASSQAEMTKIRSDEKTVYTKNSAEMKAGIEGVKKALSVLKDYYAKDGASHEKASGAGSGIIGLLEVVESDFTKGLAEMEVAESTAARDFDKVSKQNEIAKTMKGQDVKYKAREAAKLDKSVSETSGDLQGVQAELDALLEYLNKLGKMCIAKAEPFAERKARRESEIAGLKEALTILEGESLLQQTEKRSLRGIHRTV